MRVESPVALRRARELAALGCSVIPLDHPDGAHSGEAKDVGKTPTIRWAPFQATKPTEVDLQVWFGNGEPRNLAIVTGAVSDLVVIDCDSREAIAWADENLPATPWRVRTARGEHRGYRHPGEKVGNRVGLRTGGIDLKIDVRGDGGYVVAPGSLHQSRDVYEWIDGPPDRSEMPIFDVAWIAPSQNDASEAKPTIAPTVATGSRNDTLYREACRLRRLGFKREEIAAAIQVYNAGRCTPPLEEAEVARIVGSAARHDPADDAYPTTEAGDAEFFAECNRDHVRFDHRRRRWLLFDGNVWLPQTNGEIARLALQSVRARQRAAVGNSDRMKWAIGGERRQRQLNLLAHAQSMIPLADAGDSWDLDPWLLGAPNGVVDLRTGELRQGKPEDRITMRVRVAFDPTATCPLWDRTIREIFEDNEELIAYMDRYIGYSLTGDCREESLALCWGEGSNGKGTLMNTIAWLLGDYADNLPFSSFVQRDQGSIPNDIAKLDGKRYVTASEAAETRRLDEARIKALTGRDPITARFMRSEYFNFQPVAKFWLATNPKPRVEDQSEGFWRRIHFVPFTASFLGREDKTLKDRLKAEGPGILARAVRGCLEWQRVGLNPPELVREATETYRTESSPLAEFLEECCVVKDGTSAQFGQLFDAYTSWAGARRRPRLGKHKFSEALRKQFAVDANQTQRVVFIGVGLRSSMDDGL